MELNKLQKTFDAICDFVSSLNSVVKQTNIDKFQSLLQAIIKKQEGEKEGEKKTKKQIKTVISDFIIFITEYEDDILKKKWKNIEESDKIFFNTRRKKDDCVFFIPIGDLLHKNPDLRDTIFKHLIFIKTQYEDDREKKEEWFSRLKELSIEDENENETSAEDQIFNKIMGVVNGVHDSITSKGNVDEMSEKDIVKSAIDNLDVDSILGVTDSVKNGDVNPFKLIGKLMGSARDLIPTK
jgi:hypothetical protein